MSVFQGRKIVITRSVEQSKDLIDALSREKAEIITAPVIKFIPVPLTDEVKDVFSHLDRFNVILFTSSNAVRYFFYFLLRLYLKIPDRQKVTFACLGEKTAATLQTYGIHPDFVGSTRTGEEFIRELSEVLDKRKPLHFLLPSSDLAEAKKYQMLNQDPWTLRTIPIYKTVRNSNLPETILEEIKNSDNLILTFFSPSTVDYFTDFIPKQYFRPNWIIAVIGNTTRDYLEGLGIPVHVVPEKSTSEELVKAIKSYLEKERI